MRTVRTRASDIARLAILGASLAGIGLASRLHAQAAATLTTQDYVEIQQLVHRLNFALDYCSHGGRDFADLFADDGRYIVDEGDGKLRSTRGKEALAKLAGGPDCKVVLTPPRSYLAHLAENLVIEPSKAGAHGEAYAIYPGRKGRHLAQDVSGQVGLYHDDYVRTALGWRLKLRRHEVSPAAAQP